MLFAKKSIYEGDPTVQRFSTIFFHSQAVADREHFFRIVEVWDEARQRSFTFLTNQFELAASTIAAIYKDRWKVELFFKAIKQNLKIRPSSARTPMQSKPRSGQR